MDSKIQQMQALIQALNNASEAYYNGQPELMTDYEWDARFDELKRLEAETGTTLPDSPTARVSADNVSGRKEEHEYPALSLAKTKQVTDLVKWAEGRAVHVSWKLDGLTLVVTYNNGLLTKVVTRGNGHIGTNITHLAPAIGGILPSIAHKGHMVIRGEAVISYADFERFLLESGADYANPRNLASGSLTLKNVDEVKERHITWKPFTLVYTDKELPAWGDRMNFLKELGFSPVEHVSVDRPDAEQLQAAIDQFTRKVNNKENPYPVDGLVVVYNDTAFAATGSVTGHHATRAGIAFKWEDEAAATVLEHVEWSCAASTISPVAVFKPVELEGTTVKRASLCNISECERLGIGDRGTALLVIKANKIIPKVIAVTQAEGQFHIPEQCPVCGAATQVEISESSGTKTLHCTNTDCAAKQLKKFVRFVSKAGMDIDGISEQTLAKFINLGWVSKYADIYQLREHTAELENMEGFGKKSAANIMSSIEKSRKADARRLLFALNIPLVGTDVCKRLLTAYSLPELIEKARHEAADDFFAHIDGIGPEKSASVMTYFKNDAQYQAAIDLLNAVELTETSSEEVGERCKDITFVVTGDVHIYKNRNELKAYIESQGGKVTGSVSKATNFLINNDVTSTSGKNKKAQELGIPVISEDEFVARFGTTN